MIPVLRLVYARIAIRKRMWCKNSTVKGFDGDGGRRIVTMNDRERDEYPSPCWLDQLHLSGAFSQR